MVIVFRKSINSRCASLYCKGGGASWSQAARIRASEQRSIRLTDANECAKDCVAKDMWPH